MQSITSRDVVAALDTLRMKDQVQASLYEKCAGLCNKYSMQASELANQVEAFLINSTAQVLTLDMFGKLEQDIHKAKFQPSKQASTFKVVTPNEKKRPLAESFVTPSSANSSSYPNSGGSQSSTPTQSVQGPKFSDRVKRTDPVLTFNATVGERGDFVASDARPVGLRCRIQSAAEGDLFANVADRYRFMYTTLDERARAMDKHLLAVQTAMCEANYIHELQPVGVPCPDTVWVSGRICNDAQDGKINRASVLLEGSYRESGGRRVTLDLKDLGEYSLFPGQIVLVQGINAGGKSMVVKRLIEGQALPHPATAAKALQDMHYSRKMQGGRPLTVRVAAGPFTTADNLDFEPLQELMKGVLSDQPDVVIMLGPFVDANHPMLRGGDDVRIDTKRYEDEEEADSFASKKAKGGMMPCTYETIFRQRVGKDAFTRFFNNEEDEPERIATQFVLVPSVHDAFHELVFPQPPYGDREHIKASFFEEPLGKLDIPYSKDSDGPLKRVHLMPNPCMFRVNEVLFGMTSNDSLFSLFSDEVSLISENRLSRLSKHMLLQQSFCPQFPVPSGVAVPLDFRHARHWQMSECSPDVLITPSKLSPLAKELNGSLVVNPGTLSKGTTGGTYADICIHPLDENKLRDSVAGAVSATSPAAADAAAAAPSTLQHNVAARSFVKVMRI